MPLSLRLKAATRPDHRALEALMDLPASLATIEGYIAILIMFRGLHALVDARWPAILGSADPLPGFDPRSGRAGQAIDHDLQQLGTHQPVRAPGALAGEFFPTLQHVLGARYVAEGSALGNSVLLRFADCQLGAAIAPATSFLRATTQSAGADFHRYRAALDAFGEARPADCDQVIDGARTAFLACGDVLAELRAAHAGR